MLTTPAQIAPFLQDKTIDNIFFKKFLRGVASNEVDERIHRLSETVSAQVDCLQCANCCKKLEPGLEANEIETLATLKQQAIELFKQEYVAYDGEALYLKTKPCMFLNDCSCTIYEHRPAACAGYPHLNQTDMKFRRTLWENYSICPIVFNVVEELKVELGFER
ncbi:MAG: YkgJ family cysteine cluster protein [Bacteroidota bacterium]